MGGLLAARVVSDFYRIVTVVERDVLPTGSDHRRGVPQGRHIHALWPRGSQILDDLFAGFLTDLIRDGCKKRDGDFSQICASFGGHQPSCRSLTYVALTSELFETEGADGKLVCCRG
jgi:hypothetical protein